MSRETLEATIITPDGQSNVVQLPNDASARLLFLQQTVGGYIEAIPLPAKKYMVIHDEEKLGHHQINERATSIAFNAAAIRKDDYVAGVAMIVPLAALQ